MRLLMEAGERLEAHYRNTYPGLDGLEYGSEPEEDDPCSVTGYGIDEMDALDVMRNAMYRHEAARQEELQVAASSPRERESELPTEASPKGESETEAE
ncbi:hypothetical protein [Tortoise microvirus 28]|nr:hypothetical protein [Tortoise microvirus 28]